MDPTAVPNASYPCSHPISHSGADVVNEGADVANEGASDSNRFAHSNSLSRPSTFASRSDSNP